MKQKIKYKYVIVSLYLIFFHFHAFCQVALIEILPEFSETIPTGVVVNSNSENRLTIIQYDEINDKIISLYPHRSYPIWRLQSIELPSDYSSIQPEEIVSLAIEAEKNLKIHENEKTLAEFVVDFGKISICANSKSVMDAKITFYYIIGNNKFTLNEIDGHLTYFNIVENKVTLGSIGYGGSGFTSNISIFDINNIINSLSIIVSGRPLREYNYDKITIDEKYYELLNIIYQKYDYQLNEVYQNIIEEINSEEKEEELRIAQRFWLKFVESHINAIIDNRYPSELRSAIMLLEKSRLINNRIDELYRAYLTIANIII